MWNETVSVATYILFTRCDICMGLSSFPLFHLFEHENMFKHLPWILASKPEYFECDNMCSWAKKSALDLCVMLSVLWINTEVTMCVCVYVVNILFT